MIIPFRNNVRKKEGEDEALKMYTVRFHIGNMKTENKLWLQIIAKISKGPTKHKNNFYLHNFSNPSPFKFCSSIALHCKINPNASPFPKYR